MKFGLHQSPALRQELRINPRLYQAMDLLYMPLLDLQQHLKQELESNPFLDLIEPEEDETLEDIETTDKAEEDTDEQTEQAEWEDLLLDGLEPHGGVRVEHEEREFFEPTPVATTGLHDHLREQLLLLDLDPSQYVLAEEFVGNIADDGYLTASLEEILEGANKELLASADGAGPPTPYTADDVLIMRTIIQQLDPAGVGASSLQECLLLQMADAGEHETLAFQLVRDAFEDLKNHRWSDLAKRFGLDPKDVQDAADSLARLDPKPGLRYADMREEYVVPDLVVDKIEGAYRVFLNDRGLPRLRISPVYQELAKDKAAFSGENKEFISQRLNSASWMIQAIEQRRQTMLKVMNFIVDRQRDYFEKGVEHLKPLTLREVAEVIGMHESTVSRVTNGKYVQTPRGVLPLKFFFSSGLSTTSGQDASARSIRAQLQKMVEEEDTQKPLTDQQIVELFRQRGIKIARRTVAKYRDQLHILPARMRKRL